MKKYRIWIRSMVVILAFLIFGEIFLAHIAENKIQEKWMAGVEVISNSIDHWNKHESIYENNGKDIFGKEYTASEWEDECAKDFQARVIAFNNCSVMYDAQLPDGSWLIGGDDMFLKLFDENDNATIYTVETSELFPIYRKYTASNKYYYDVRPDGFVEKSIVYYLVPNSFYIDGQMIYISEADIYLVEDEGIEWKKWAILEKKITLNVPEEHRTDLYFERKDELRASDLNRSVVKFDYECESLPGGMSGSWWYLLDDYEDPKANTGKDDMKVDREKFRDGILQYGTVGNKWDVLGFEKYKQGVIELESDYYGGTVKVVYCERNYFYHAYIVLWKIVLLVLAADMMIATVCSAIIFGIGQLVKKERKNV